MFPLWMRQLLPPHIARMTRAILDFPDPTGAVRRLTFAEPLRIITATTHAGIRPALRDVEDLARAGGWAVGCLAYEAAPAFDRALTTRPPAPDMPLLWFGIFDAPHVADGAERGAPDVADGADVVTLPTSPNMVHDTSQITWRT
jgi:hypothetical protein